MDSTRKYKIKQSMESVVSKCPQLDKFYLTFIKVVFKGQSLPLLLPNCSIRFVCSSLQRNKLLFKRKLYVICHLLTLIEDFITPLLRNSLALVLLYFLFRAKLMLIANAATENKLAV